MQAKLGFSQLQDDRNYVDKVLIVFGIFMYGSATAVAFPALVHLAHKLF